MERTNELIIKRIMRTRALAYCQLFSRRGGGRSGPSEFIYNSYLLYTPHIPEDFAEVVQKIQGPIIIIMVFTIMWFFFFFLLSVNIFFFILDGVTAENLT